MKRESLQVMPRGLFCVFLRLILIFHPDDTQYDATFLNRVNYLLTYKVVL